MTWPRLIFRHRERLEARDWHPWFAWYPVADETQWYWLTRVHRRVQYALGWRINHYRPLPKGSPDGD